MNWSPPGQDTESRNLSPNPFLPSLYRAAERGHKDVLLLLIGRGARPDEADKYGQTPLHGAALNGHLEVVKLLLDRGSACDRASSWGGTPLYYAAMHGHKDAARELLNRGSIQFNLNGLFNRIFNRGFSTTGCPTLL